MEHIMGICIKNTQKKLTLKSPKGLVFFKFFFPNYFVGRSLFELFDIPRQLVFKKVNKNLN